MSYVNEERLLNEFIELVQIDSETKHEEKIASVLKKKFTALGLEVTEDNAKEKTGHGAGNLICTLRGNKSNADPIYFTSHMDTVVPGKILSLPFRTVISFPTEQPYLVLTIKLDWQHCWK